MKPINYWLVNRAGHVELMHGVLEYDEGGFRMRLEEPHFHSSGYVINAKYYDLAPQEIACTGRLEALTLARHRVFSNLFDQRIKTDTARQQFEFAQHNLAVLQDRLSDLDKTIGEAVDAL